MERLDLPVIVVDDGSDDAQRDVIQALAQTARVVHLLSHEQNLGKGAAVLAGLREAAARGFSHALQKRCCGRSPT
jgi:glycosyltransferase involved in cell wall biosynthesis